MSGRGAVTAIPPACLTRHPGWRRMQRFGISAPIEMKPFSGLLNLLPKGLASISGSTLNNRSIWAVMRSSISSWLISLKVMLFSLKCPISRSESRHHRYALFWMRPVSEMRLLLLLLSPAVIPSPRLLISLVCTTQPSAESFASVSASSQKCVSLVVPELL